MTNVGFGTANSNIRPIQNRGSDAASNSGEQSPWMELAERVDAVSTYMEFQQRLEREEAAKDFANEVKKCEGDGVRFSGKPGPDGHYRIEGGVQLSPRALGNLQRLAVAAARVGEVQITTDVVRIVRDHKPSFDDPRYPISRQIYEAAYEKLDPNSLAAIALKKEFGA